MELFYFYKRADHSTKFGLPCASFKHTNKNNIFIIVNTLTHCLFRSKPVYNELQTLPVRFNQTEVKYI